MGRKVIDMTGMRFGRLTVLELVPKSNDKARFKWLCRCDCGTVKAIDGSKLRNGSTVSCGCYHREVNSTKLRVYHKRRKVVKAVVARREDQRKRQLEYNAKAREKINDDWMFGDSHVVERLKKMFY